MIADGTEVYWTQRDYGGNAVRIIRTRTVGVPFEIQRSTGGTVTCCRLSVNRIARLEDIATSEPPKIEAQRLRGGRSDDLPSNDRCRAQDAPPVALPTVPKQAQKPVRTAHTPPPKPENAAQTADAPCNLLAIDFLNVLVRAFHAGKPTDTHAVRSMFQTVANSIRKLRPAHVVFAMDGGHKMRSELLPAYKAHRPDPDPLLTAQKKLAETALQVAGFQCIRIQDWEADDVLATLASHYSDTVIASCDKDLLAMTGQAIRCRIFHPWGDGSFMTAEEKIGLPPGQIADYLALCGDTSDGIPGVKGIGPKTAVSLLTEYGSLEAIIASAVTGQIKGATGKRLKDLHADALLCRRVVELNTRLPLPELEDFSPVALWQAKLQDLRLGSVAAIMDSLKGQHFRISDIKSQILPKERYLSAATLQAEQVKNGSDSGAQASPESAAVTDHHRQEVTPPSHQQEPPKPNSTEDSLTRNQIGQAAPVAGADNAIQYWEAGRRCAGNTVENPWKPDTWNHLAWQQGFDGLELNLTATDVLVAPKLKSNTPNTRHSMSLFE